MIAAPIPIDEDLRLSELYKYELLDTPYEEEFDDVVKLASQICGTSISAITLVDASRQWFKAKVGLAATETTREVSFCAHAIVDNVAMFEVEDASQDVRFHDNPLVTSDPNIKFYAGVPLVSSNGFKLGMLCVIDAQPHTLNKQQTFALKVLGDQVMRLMEARIRNKQIEAQRLELEKKAAIQNRMMSIIAHDIRSPMSALKSIIDLAEEKILSSEQTKELTSLTGMQLDTTLSLLDDLIGWGLMQTSQVSQQKQLLTIQPLIEQLITDFKLTASLKNNEIKCVVKDGLQLLSNQNSLLFILRNLLSNANKFTSNGTIEIHAKHELGKTIFIVKDNGVGMTSDIKNRLFTDKAKTPKLGTNKEKGTGLGLLLVKDFIDNLDGIIKVESEPGKGTSIYFAFKA